MKNISIIILILLIIMLINTGCSKKNTDKKVEQLLSQMTLEEKVALIHANSKFTIPGVKRLGIPELTMSDGPHGIREELERDSWNSAHRTDDSSSYMPNGVCLASTWNTDLAYEYGRVLSAEARHRDKDILLAPGVNIMRTPVCGRNFEYFGEDPWLVSRMAVNYINGVQSQGVAACVKHYFANNQEYLRNSINVEMADRVMHEIYLPAFKAAVQEANVMAVMGAYNKFRGQFCSHNELLNTKILKGDWGFEGIVISDWNATQNTSEAITNGLDVEMGTHAPSYNEYYLADPFLELLKNGAVEQHHLNDKARRILRTYYKTRLREDLPQGAFNTPEHQKLARTVAEEGIVLLKNEHDVLPLKKGEIKSIAVIGDNATREHHFGGGSSTIKALYEISPLEGLKNKVGDHIQINYAPGYSLEEGVDVRQLYLQAMETARNSDCVIFCGGLTHILDNESHDKPDLKLPYGQAELIQALLEINPNTIIVLIAGSPVEMGPWINKAQAVALASYPGMEGGAALTNIIFGDVNPSGKLPCTFPRSLADSPAHALDAYPGKDGTVEYKEGIYVGYRYFDTFGVNPQFAFGHGLSYTTFDYSDLQIIKKDVHSFSVTLKIKNSGVVAGKEVVQLYVIDSESSVERPLKELRAFLKVFVEPGQTKNVHFDLDKSAFAFFDEKQGDWVVESGEFEILIGSSSVDIRLAKNITL